MNFSFCTNARDRMCDLERTLPNNLSLLKGGEEEIVLLDYNSPDGLRDWVLKSFAADLGAGRLRLYSERTAPRFFMAHAKNVCHLLGRGNILINLDADNHLRPTYLAALRDANWERLSMLYPYFGTGGYKGRTAVKRQSFLALGGYNEDLNLGYGYEEIDLFRRLGGCKMSFAAVYLTDDDCIVTPDDKKLAGQAVVGMSLRDSNKAHRKICEANLRRRNFVANAGRLWGRATVYDHNDAPQLVGA